MIEDFLKKANKMEITFFNRFVVSLQEGYWIIYDYLYRSHYTDSKNNIIRFRKLDNAYAQCKAMVERK